MTNETTTNPNEKQFWLDWIMEVKRQFPDRSDAEVGAFVALEAYRRGLKDGHGGRQL